ncbi:ATP-dependent DNA helicase [Trichonephila clavipes]|nr:ATP-dependent DNA helicase [Trichonephila clavipes]
MASQRDTETIEAAESRKRAAAERAQQRFLIITRNPWGVLDKAAFEYDETLDYESHKLIKIEAMNKECRFCGARKWKEESAGMCCLGVTLPSIGKPVEHLKELYSYETDQSRRFLKNIRKYNTCFHMTSFGADNIVSMHGFCPTFTIQGQIYRAIGTLLPATNTQPKFLQVYFMGVKEDQVNRRYEYIQGVERNTVKKIQEVLHDHNILVHEFKMAKYSMTSDNYKVVMQPDCVPRSEYERRFNAPTTNETAAVVVSSERTASQDIVIQAHDGRLTSSRHS